MTDRQPSRAIHNSNYDRIAGDHYATPEWVSEALLRNAKLRGPIWEPCCGAGQMAEVLRRHDFEVVASDLNDYGYGRPGVDIGACTRLPDGCRALVTNPPYSGVGTEPRQGRAPAAMLDFVRHTLALAEPVGGQVALLVRLQWIAGQRAAALLSAAPFVATIVLTQRISWFDYGARTNQAQHHHAWILVDYQQPTATTPALLFAGKHTDAPLFEA